MMRRVPLRLWLPSLATLSLLVCGCYEPTFIDCNVTCGTSGALCPAGLSCQSGFCRVPGAAGHCSAGGDMSVSMRDGGAGSCGHATTGGRWVRLPNAPNVSFARLWGAGCDLFAATGDLYHSGDGGESWQLIFSPGANVTGVWGSATGDLYVSGWNGTLQHSSDGGKNFDAVTCSSCYPSAGRVDLDDVWGVSAGNVFAIGVQGTVLQSSSAWQALATGSTETFTRMGGSSGDLYVAGGSVLLHLGGADTTWTQRTPPGGATLTDVWDNGGGNVYVVGSGGAIMHTQNGGASWDTPASNTAADLYAVWGQPGALYAVGAGGVVIRSGDGVTWQRETVDAGDLGSLPSLLAVWGTGDEVFAAGDGGFVIHKL
jgi:photosystem II stability/assembly factor-like uncharacterized protein